jgi:hypothetical protein
VLSREEKLRWLALHGATMRATLPPRDEGHRFNEEALAELERELTGGGTA